VLQTPPVATSVVAPAMSQRQSLDDYVRSQMNAPALEPAEEQTTINSGWAAPAAR